MAIGSKQKITEADRLAADLKRKNQRLVLAESCTSGLAAAQLSQTPGVSKFFCGSFVVYQIDSKHRWLGVSRAIIRKHDVVSAQVAQAMASGALRKTPHAKMAGAITGYLGPTGPKDRLGEVWICAMMRDTKKMITQQFFLLPRSRLPARAARTRRQRMASQLLLGVVRSLLTGQSN